MQKGRWRAHSRGPSHLWLTLLLCHSTSLETAASTLLRAGTSYLIVRIDAQEQNSTPHLQLDPDEKVTHGQRIHIPAWERGADSRP